MWSVGGGEGSGDSSLFDMEIVATNEIGHILGLAHSKDKEALMYTVHPMGKAKKLAKDDIDGIRIIYTT